MTDLRDILSPNIIQHNLAPIGNTIQSEITGEIFTVLYTRSLWSGTYIWDRNENLQEVVAHLRDIDNRYIIPLYHKKGEYDGTLSDWTVQSPDVLRSTREFDV